MPEDASWADVRETLAVNEDIEVALKESDAGLGVDTNTLRRLKAIYEYIAQDQPRTG